MNRINRRRLVAVTSVAATSAVLVACGNEPAAEDELNPTQISDVPGAPPTLAPITEKPGSAPAEETADSGSESGGGNAVSVDAFDLGFEPTELTIAPDTDVTITFTNTGFIPHDFVIEDTDFATAEHGNGESEDLVVNLAEGEYTFFCSVPGHRESGMEGKIIVSADAAASAPAEEEAAGSEGGATEAAVDAFDLGFEPTELTIAADTDVTITFTNTGFIPHDFVIEDTDFATQQLQNEQEEDLVVNLAPGEYTFYCSVPGHRESGMEGTITVE